MGIGKIGRKIWEKVTGKAPEKKLPGVDYAKSGVLEIGFLSSAARVQPHEIEKVDVSLTSLGASSLQPTIGMVRGDKAIIVGKDEQPFDREAFLDQHKKLKVGLLAESLTIGALTQLAARPQVDLVETIIDTPLSVAGDFHGNRPRYERHLGLVEAGLRNDTERFLSLGDLGHAETAANVFNNRPSLIMNKAHMMLSLLFPKTADLCVGNHDGICTAKDYFDAVMKFIEQNEMGTILDLGIYLNGEGLLDHDTNPRVMLSEKNGVPQSYFMLHYLCLALKEQGFDPGGTWEIIQLLQKYYDTSPMAWRAKTPDGEIDFFAAHSLPQGVTSIEQLRTVRDPSNKAIYDSMISSRPSDEPGDGLFVQADVPQFMRAIGMSPKNGWLFFGHTRPANGWYFSPFPNVIIAHNNKNGFGRIRVHQAEDGSWQVAQETMKMNKPELFFSH